MWGKWRGLGIAAVAVGLVGLLLGLGGLGCTRHAFGGPVVSGESMGPTYKPGDRVVFERVDGSEVRRGDVVMFSAPDRYCFDGLVMERVIGVGGDHVACCTGAGADTRLSVNGKPLQEPYPTTARTHVTRGPSSTTRAGRLRCPRSAGA